MSYKTYSEINGAILHVCLYSLQLKLRGRVHGILNSSRAAAMLILQVAVITVELPVPISGE